MILQATVLSVLFCSVHSRTIRSSVEKSEDSSGNSIDDDDLSVSTLIQKANINVGKNIDGSLVKFGDIAVPTGLRNADPCTDQDCLWPKSSNGKVYVPYQISPQYSPTERNTIIQALESFSPSTCIRFIPRTSETDFLDIMSGNGCSSYVGRIRGSQVVSLKRRGCVFLGVIQHELLHALGFKHEHSRSDRDQHVEIQWQNIESGKEHNFEKVDTRNLGTPYDYNSVMQYGRDFFSKNGLDTIVPIPDRTVPIGTATQMNRNDILRVNRLFQCGRSATRADLEPVQRNHFL